MSERYFDDFRVGERFRTGEATFSEPMMVEFAQRYDPQPFHLDKAAAEGTIYGGLIASGFQTLSLSGRLFLEAGFFAACSMGSPGMDELRWYLPVRPGDTIRVEMEVLEVRPSSSRADRGILRARYEVFNQQREKVMSYIIAHLLARRPGA